MSLKQYVTHSKVHRQSSIYARTQEEVLLDEAAQLRSHSNAAKFSIVIIDQAEEPNLAVTIPY